MAEIFITFSILATLHFIYDGIILPGIRQHYRNRIFAMRDKLRWEIISGNIQPKDLQAFNLAHDSLNTFANRLPMLTISVQKEFQDHMNSNPRLRTMIEERCTTLENCQNEIIKSITNELNATLKKTYIANAGGWFIYLIPIAIIVLIIKTLAKMSSELAVAPEQEVSKIIPTDQNNSICC